MDKETKEMADWMEATAKGFHDFHDRYVAEKRFEFWFSVAIWVPFITVFAWLAYIY